ncbi:MAG TPA: fused MFS/spermidine synthase [Chthoniobacteraceae bacterium]|jgi:spermidine synthase|nr:fused MFS/spermidine synthase [Chthoniobacteraceae bacterium]
MLLSGAGALAYEIVWLRALDLLFGQTAGATAAVVSAFMAGLGFGSHVIGRWIDRARTDIVRIYGWIEGGIACCALLSPLLWRGIDAADLAFQRACTPSATVEILFKFLIAFLALLPPTFLMGGTLPVAVKALVRTPNEAGRFVGLLYGINTLGAAAGVFLSGFVLLPAIGMRATMFCAAGCGGLISALCVGRKPAPASGNIPCPVEPALATQSTRTRILHLLFAVSGITAMLYEVAWTRVMAVTLGSSVYAFSIMLGTFLVGIAIGSGLFSRFMAPRISGGLKLLALLQMALGILVLLGTNQLDDLPFQFVQLYGWSHGNITQIEFGKILLCAMVVLPPATVLGAAFGCFIHACRRASGIGSQVGTAYLANTTGNIAGAAFTGLLIIPAIGAQYTLVAGAVLNVGIGLAVWLLRGRRLLAGSLFATAVVAAGVMLVRPWDRLIFASGMVITPKNAVGLTREAFHEQMHWKTNLYFREGTRALVSVDRWQDQLFLSVNGKVDASTSDAFTQLYIGHLPMLLHPQPKSVLVIGLGSGMTLGAVAAYPVERIDCAEIEPAVAPAARFFDNLSRRALDDPRIHLHIDDGRNFLRARAASYDVIISEPSNPWIAGVANLFSRDFYATAAGHLQPGGIFCQWFQAYSMSPDDLRMIVKTFSGVFPHVSLWSSFYPDLVLIGSGTPDFDFTSVKRGFAIRNVSEDMAIHGGIRAPEGLLGTFLLGDGELRQLAAGARTNTDDHPYLEFSAPWHLYDDTERQNLDLIQKYSAAAQLPITGITPGSTLWAEVARTLIARKSTDAARAALDQSAKIEPGNARWLEVSGILDAGLGKLDTSRQLLMAAIATGKATPEAHYYLGLIENATGDPASARREYEAALAIEPDNPAYLRAAAQLGQP